MYVCGGGCCTIQPVAVARSSGRRGSLCIGTVWRGDADGAQGEVSAPFREVSSKVTASGGREVVNAVAEGKKAARGIHALLAGDRIRELLNAGFPARFQFRVELWSEGRFFDAFEKAGEYTLLVRYLPADRLYEATHVQDERAFSLGRFTAVADAERAIGRAMAAPVNARPAPRRQYYQATLTVEVLSENDIDEVARWLKGDIEPGITGKANPASVITRGVRALATRLLGGEKAEYEATTPPFRVP